MKNYALKRISLKQGCKCILRCHNIYIEHGPLLQYNAATLYFLPSSSRVDARLLHPIQHQPSSCLTISRFPLTASSLFAAVVFLNYKVRSLVVQKLIYVSSEEMYTKKYIVGYSVNTYVIGAILTAINRLMINN